MRLTKLKLAGFKTFVDPTSVLFPGQLVGVVGPNGCGKSNIIDAVRWVLGESKATALRGESMQDVIFNGSSNRKPVGRASVELVFDNSLGKIGGQWSQYGEIAVKRVLERNGDSSYYINNLHVRRRDVIDLFLGTGLGPRAYAIIEQGMISRIIEAKPEELRLFLEEAAGVTKYKERRKETESRLGDARENLARVEDIRNELEGQIVKLEGQAEVARQYQELQADLGRRQALLWLLKRNDAQAERDKLARDIDKAATRLEAETAALRELESQLERTREGHFAASDAVHAAQSEMFAANAEVARLESELQHLRDTRHKLEQRLAQLAAEEAQWRGQLDAADRDEARWQDLAQAAGLRAASAEQRHEVAAAALPDAEAALEAAQAETNACRRELGQAEQQVRVEEAHRANAQRALESLEARRVRLEQESTELSAPDARALSRLQSTVAGLRSQAAEHQTEVASLQAALPEVEAALRRAQEQERAIQKSLMESRARRDALLQLQKRVKQQGGVAEWLKRRGLDEEAPLWRALRVEPGWEMALEALLRERLGALAAHERTQAAAALADPAPGSVCLALDAEPARAAPARGELGGTLAALVSVTEERWRPIVDAWLQGVHVADDLAAVLERRAELGACECWVGRSGQVVSRHGLSFYAPDERTHGVIERQREIDQLDARLAELGEALARARESVEEAEKALARHREQLNVARKTAQELQQRLHAVHVEALKLTQAQQRFEERRAQVERDLAEVGQSEHNERERRQRAEIEAARHRELAQALRDKAEAASQAQQEADRALREARALEQQLARELQESRFSERECAAKLEEIGRARALAHEQLERLSAELEASREERGGIDEQSVAAALQAALAARQENESRLTQRRVTLEELSAQLRSLEEGRLKTEQGLQPLRDRIGELRLKEQAAQLAQEQYAARLAECQADEAQLAPLLTRELKEAGLQNEIGRINQAIADLGAVNMAALEELEAARGRKGFLDAQSADLNEAIGTLEDAIRRIDRETREQLRETYEQVNRQFGSLFPELFGGGEARLILTGEEILDAGLQVMAQPPGKKNASIHLLSGGEKALTATALVFSLFQLNPAPFCMLDEVDAPLDDTNTERFCEMVKRMSKQTQFVFISHNKLTMEMAQQLIGVTMQESGVSRVVEVDIVEALRLREEAA